FVPPKARFMKKNAFWGFAALAAAALVFIPIILDSVQSPAGLRAALSALFLALLAAAFFIPRFSKQGRDSRQDTLPAALEQRKVQEKISAILDASPMICAIFDKESKCEYANEAVAGILKAGKDEYIDNFERFLPPFQPDGSPSMEKSNDLIAEAFEKGEATFEFMYRRKDGSPVPVEETAKRVKIDGQERVVCYTRDLSDYYKLKESELLAQKQALDAVKLADKKKGEFLAHMSHEIRTPMNAIAGMAELSLNAQRPELIREYVGTIKQASASLLSIVNDILDFSKIEAGKLEVASKEYSLASLINDVINIVRVKAADSRLRFLVNVDPKLPEALTGDDIRIRQVLLNVLSNAFKYTERGFVSLFIGGELSGENEITLALRVADTGIGIKEGDMEKLFMEYAQFDLDKNRSIEGAGLGLPIVKRLLDKMGGEISVFSEYGKGSTFTLTLPQKFQSGKPLACVKDPQDKKALVFEQREIYRDFMQNAFDSLGVRAEFVLTEADLQEKAASGGFPFVFIPAGKYKKHAAALGDIKKKSKVVILSQLGEAALEAAPEAAHEAAQETDASILEMPFHSIVIAGILNSDAKAAFSYGDNAKFVARFTAPAANILVVDDIVTNLKVAKGLLLPYKANVDICKSGITAVEAVKTNRYDLVFMDHKMPGLDGVETTKRIRALAAGDAPADAAGAYFKDLPIVALTANAVDGAKEMFLENGLNDFLSKPIDTVKLGQILETWLPKEKREKN
ncbi:MAG: ATP-binding protein, partial [Spirochaetes bacterium]|nr:ATP-binding protein [Spirochaetota bacterium]